MPRIGATKLTLTRPLREELESLVRSQTAEVRLARRARIVLLAAEGSTNAAIAARVGVTEKTARLWRDRFTASPRLETLRDRPRSGRPPDVPMEVRLELVRLACERPMEDKTPFRDLWTQEALRVALEKTSGWTLSVSEVGRILRARDLRPHRVRMWLNSQDPHFGEKARRVCAWYTEPREDVTVLCVDEKRLFAHQRLAPLKPATGRHPVREEFAYRRNGTSTLLAAFDVRTGEVYGECRPRRRAEDLLEFMETLATSIPGEVVIIWDNLNVHHDGKDARWTAFNARQGDRFTFVHTPLHASWLNQVEIWFSTLERRVLRHGSFVSVDDLIRRVEGFIDFYNDHLAHPYRWTFRAEAPRRAPHAQLQGRALPCRAAHPLAA